MTDKLRLRAYNVLFGDAILLSIPDRDDAGQTHLRHILIDVGNAYRDKAGGSRDFVFEPIVEDIRQELGDKPLDLYILTHEHLDHVQGLRHAATRVQPGLGLPIKRAWITASAAPNYHTRFPNTRELKQVQQMVDEIRLAARALKAAGEDVPTHVPLLLDINDPGLTGECVLYILSQALDKDFVFRDYDLANKHPFHEVKFDIWAPEEDVSVYYHAIRKIGLAADVPSGKDQLPVMKRISPPLGVDTFAFNNLLKIRQSSLMDTLLCIDKAANNTSVVFTLEWRGWKLLFAGDAEQQSWEMMDGQGKLSEVDFIKISHHGSRTGTPPAALLERIFPSNPTKERLGLVSTFRGTYNDVPDQNVLDQYRALGVNLVSVGDDTDPQNCAPGRFRDIFFPEYGNAPEY